MIGAIGGLGYDDEPACWAWEPPAPDAWERYPEKFDSVVRPTLSKEICQEGVLDNWHQGRCAICGAQETLVTDHDHETGLIRGRLCRSCNVQEAVNPDGIWRRYRERPPAAICGFTCRYFNPRTGEYAKPVASGRDSYDPWGGGNALRGAAL